MDNKEGHVALSAVIMKKDGKSNHKLILELLLENDTPVICERKESGQRKTIPFSALHKHDANFWQKDSFLAYFLSQEDFVSIRDKSIFKHGFWELDTQEEKAPVKEEPAQEIKEEKIEEPEITQGYGSDYDVFAKMSTPDKLKHLGGNNQRLSGLLSNKNNTGAVTETIMETAKDAALINRAVMEEVVNIPDDEAKKYTRALVYSILEMVNSSMSLINKEAYRNDLMNKLLKKSNGTIVQHMTRVYVNAMAFLSYYNKKILTSSIVQKIRSSFNAKYRSFYHTLLPHMEYNRINLERVFREGMTAIPNDLLNKWVVGFLIHDIGKTNAVEYHEGEANYDRTIITEHVKLGYMSVINKTMYPKEASLITGYHHEYYGHPTGYGYFRTHLEGVKQSNPQITQEYCVTYDMDFILSCKAHAYFPAKVLEIVDVYDSVTDVNRVYRKAMSSDEALDMMFKEFIIKNKKLDPILFDMFIEFIRDEGSSKR